jgi:hypothetical protein
MHEVGSTAGGGGGIDVRFKLERSKESQGEGHRWQQRQQTKETKGQGVSTPFPEANFRRSFIAEAAQGGRERCPEVILVVLIWESRRFKQILLV